MFKKLAPDIAGPEGRLAGSNTLLEKNVIRTTRDMAHITSTSDPKYYIPRSIGQRSGLPVYGRQCSSAKNVRERLVEGVVS